MKRGRMGTRIAAGALALVLAAGLTAAPADALDVWFSQPSGWAAADVDRAAEEGLLKPYYIGSDLRGDITREEFAVLAVTLAQKLGLPVDLYDPNMPEAPFADLDGSTGTAYIRAAWDLVLAAPTSREQAMVLTLRSLDLGKDTLEEQNFTAAQREQIARLKELRATFGSPGEPYAQVPGLSAPYSPGGLTDAFLQDGLNAINYIRAGAGGHDRGEEPGRPGRSPAAGGGHL